jgi:hypothetical protein
MALDWQEAGGFLQADVVDGIGPGRTNVYDHGATYRIYQRGTPHAYELLVWTGPADHRPGVGANEEPLPPTVVWKYFTPEEAKAAASRTERNRNHFAYHAVVNGFGIQFQSDIDGDRYVIVDERDHDMTGWKIETSTSYGNQVELFTRDHPWYCYDTGVFDCFGYGGAEKREPWSAFCDHGQKIVRWIPPDTISD